MTARVLLGRGPALVSENPVFGPAQASSHRAISVVIDPLLYFWPDDPVAFSCVRSFLAPRPWIVRWSMVVILGHNSSHSYEYSSSSSQDTAGRTR